MDANKKYVTQLSRKDLKEIAAAANAYGGEGIDVTPTTDGLEISIDKEQLTRWVRAIITGLGPNVNS